MLTITINTTPSEENELAHALWNAAVDARLAARFSRDGETRRQQNQLAVRLEWLHDRLLDAWRARGDQFETPKPLCATDDLVALLKMEENQ